MTAAITGSRRSGSTPAASPPRLRHIGRRERRLIGPLDEAQSRARSFADSQLRPVALELDRRTGEDPSYFDWNLVAAGGRQGILDFLVPAEIGGGGALTTQYAVVMEELCAACPGLALIFGAHGLGISPLLLDGPLHWDVMAGLVESARCGEPELMALALTEPDAGTDVEDPEMLTRARVTSEARRVPGGYALSGSKRFISNGSVARWLTVLMPVDPRRPTETWTCFLVDSESKGFSVARNEHKLGQRACPATELVFDEVFVPDERLVGRVGDGAGATLIVLGASRPPVGAIATGIARGAYERLLDWLRKDPDGRRLLETQAVQLRLASMAEHIRLARHAYMDAAIEMDTVTLGPAARSPLLRSLRFVPKRVHRNPALRRLATSPRVRDALAGFLNRTSSDAAVSRSLGLSSRPRW